MGTIQSSIALYNVIETLLRQALQENLPRTFREISENQDVLRVASKPQQIRDVVSTFRKKGYIIKKPMREFSDKYTPNEFGWVWNPDAESVVNTPPAHKANTKPSKPVIVKPDIGNENEKEIELVFGTTTIIVGKNPLTGRIRITIDAD